MKKYLMAAAMIVIPGVAYAGYNLSTKSFPDANYPNRSYDVVIEDAAGDILSTDYVGIYRTTTGDAELFSVDQFAGVGSGATKDEISRVADVSARLVTLGSSEAITVASHEGKTLCFGSAAGTATLPAATGSGAVFKLTACAVPPAAGYVVTVTGDDTIDGQVTSTQDSGDTVVGWETASNTDTITFTSSTKMGATIGAWVELQDTGADQWTVRGQGTSTGSEASPFSGS